MPDNIRDTQVIDLGDTELTNQATLILTRISKAFEVSFDVIVSMALEDMGHSSFRSVERKLNKLI